MDSLDVFVVLHAEGALAVPPDFHDFSPWESVLFANHPGAVFIYLV